MNTEEDLVAMLASIQQITNTFHPNCGNYKGLQAFAKFS